jgi:hypothetical protein
MELSIVVLTCNQRDYTLGLLRSIDNFMQHHDAEFILIDNASTDNTIADVRRLASAWTEKLRIIINAQNRGVAAARNQGLKVAQGDKILILDNDTTVTTEAIEQLIAYLDRNEKCGIVAPALYSPAGERQQNGKPFPSIGLKIRHIFHLPDTASEREATHAEHPFYVIGACQMFRRSLLAEIGLLDERIFYGPEDADFCMRIAATGQKIDLCNKIAVIHDWQRATRKSPFSKLSWLHFKALMYFYFKHRGGI